LNPEQDLSTSTAKGQLAEERAVRYLKRRGYTILARNVRLARGELDIVALQTVARDSSDEKILVFIEVKGRRCREDALLAMHEDKCRRIRSASLAYLNLHPDLAALQCRFDLIILTPRRWFARIEHLKDIMR